MDDKILSFIKKIRARLGGQAVLDAMMMSVTVGLLIAVLISVISLWIPMYYAIPASAGVVLLFFIIGIVLGIKITPSLGEAALIADSKGHKEKITTALELRGREDSFSMLQKRDALKVIEGFRIGKEFPLKLSWKRCGAFVLLAVLFSVTGMLDTPARRLAVTRHEVKEEALKEVAKLEKVKKELSKADKLTDVEKAELTDQLEQAKQDMRRAETVEDLKKAEDRITKKMEMDAEAIQDAEAKKTLADAVSENKADQAKRIEDAAEQAEKAMDKAAIGDDEKSKRDAYESLNKLAEASGDEALKKAAEEYKKSGYSTSDYLAANQALKNAMNNMSNSDMAENSTNGAVNNSGDDNESNNGNSSNNGQQGSQGQNGENGQQGSQGQNGENGQQGSQGQNGNNGQQGSQGQNGENGQQGSQGQNGNNGQQGSQGQNGNSGQQGQGQNGNNGNQGSGFGSGSGSGSGNGGGPGWNRGSKTGVEGKAKVNEDVTIPDGTSGSDDDLLGKANGNDTSTKQKSSQANTWSGNKVSYGQVSGEYKEKAYKKVNGSSYPGKMKEKIRDYFDGLE